MVSVKRRHIGFRLPQAEHDELYKALLVHGLCWQHVGKAVADMIVAGRADTVIQSANQVKVRAKQAESYLKSTRRRKANDKSTGV